MDRIWTQCVISVLCLTALLGGDRCRAAASHEDLVARISLSLNEELPPAVRGLAILRLDGSADAGLDAGLLRESLELSLVRDTRFVLAGRRKLDAALEQSGLCDRLPCFSDPETLRRFGAETGIDALLIGGIVDTSRGIENLNGRQCFVTARLRAVSTDGARTLWERQITGVDTLGVAKVLGELPAEEFVAKEEAFGLSVARFLEDSAKIAAAGVKTLALLDFEGVGLEGELLYPRIAGAIASETRFTLIDREYLRAYLADRGLELDTAMDTVQKRSLGLLLGIDGFVEGRVVSADENHIRCVVRLSSADTITDVDAELLDARASNAELALPALLSAAGPSSIETQPPGAAITLDGVALGPAPRSHWIPGGEHELAFTLPGHESKVLTVSGDYGRSQNLFVELSPRTRSKALLRSLVIPGLGQRYGGRGKRAWIFSIAAVGAAGFAMLNQNAYDSAIADYELASASYRAAYSQSEMDAAFAVMEESFASAEDTRGRRDFALLALGGVWLASVLDAALSSPFGDVQVQVNAIRRPNGEAAVAAGIGVPLR